MQCLGDERHVHRLTCDDMLHRKVQQARDLVLHEDRAFHQHGNFGMGTRMCVLVSPSEYERAMRLVADFVLGKDKCD